MGYYVLYDTAEFEIVTSWAAARERIRGRSGASCHAFRTKNEAEEFVDRLQFAHPPDPDNDIVVYVEGMTNGSIVVCAAYFGECDSRNCVRQITELSPNMSPPRAKLAAAILGIEAAVHSTDAAGGGASIVILLDCNFVCKAYQLGFPTKWSNQDLLQKLASLCTETNSRIKHVQRHQGVVGHERAHALCNLELQKEAATLSKKQ